MSFSIQLRQLTGEENLVTKANAFSNTTVMVNGTLKEACSVIDPVFLIAGDTWLLNYNYATVTAFSRHYFITNIISVRNGLWEVHMHVDVLYSYADVLLETKALFQRSNLGTPTLSDDMAVQTYEPTINVIRPDSIYPAYGYVAFAWDYSFSNDDSWNYIAVVYSQKNSLIGGADENMRNATYSSMAYPCVLNALSAYNLQYQVLTQTDAPWGSINIEPSECIISLREYPFSLSDFCEEETVEEVTSKVTTDLEIAGKVINGLPMRKLIRGNTGGLTNSPSFAVKAGLIMNYQKYLPTDCTRYSSIVMLWIPFYGWYNVNVKETFDKYNHLFLQYNIDIINGSFTCNIYVTNSFTHSGITNADYLIDTVSGKIGRDIPLSRTNNADISRNQAATATNVVTSFAFALTASLANPKLAPLAFAGVGSAVLKGATDAFSQINHYSNNPGQSMGLCTDEDLNVKLCVITYPLLEARDVDMIGYPDYTYHQIKDVSGYAMINLIHLENLPNATSAERDEIQRKLKEGFHVVQTSGQ